MAAVLKVCFFGHNCTVTWCELAPVVVICDKCKKTVVYTRVNGALHIEKCKNYKKVITHQHIAEVSMCC